MVGSIEVIYTAKILHEAAHGRGKKRHLRQRHCHARDSQKRYDGNAFGSAAVVVLPFDSVFRIWHRAYVAAGKLDRQRRMRFYNLIHAL